MSKIDKVITSLQDINSMEQINKLTNISYDATDNWVDLGMFIEVPKLKKYITEEDFNELVKKNANYIAFRLDE